MKKEMKKILSILSLASVVIFIACQEDFEVENLSFPPNVIVLQPADNGQVPIGGFDVKAVIVDGPGSPLASGSITLKDAAGNTVVTEEKDMSGTRDSLFIEGSTFDAASLGVGAYTLDLTVTDTDGQSTVMQTEFEIVNSLYVSNETEMYVSGDFNTWGPEALTLVDNYTWEIDNVNLTGSKFKFRNNVDWVVADDWGDADCNGVMAITTGGGPDTDCGYTGLVNIRFNDETLAYTVSAAVTYAKNVNTLFLLGNINNFSGPPDYPFEHTADNTWILNEVRLKVGDAFKFAESKTFEGRNFGDAEFDGQAEEFGGNIVMPVDQADAFYKITFNDNTLAYTIELLRMPYPDNLYLVGGTTAAGWDPPSSIPFRKTGEGQFEIYAYINAGDGFKFLEVQDWAGDWGADPNNAGKIIQEGETNAQVADAGFYRVTVNYNDLSYSVVETNWGVIGNASPGGWDADTDMTYVSGTTWGIDVTLGAGEYKFRANDDWAINMGVDTGDLLRQDGGNFASPGAGDYHIEMDLDPVAGYTYTITPL